MDFEGLGQRVLERLEHDAAVALGFHVLNATERAVYFAYRARQMVGNGGFKYFYEGAAETPVGEVIQGFRILGFDAAAEAFARTTSTFPGGRVPTKLLELHRLELDFGPFEADEEVVADVSYPAFEASVGRYYHKHRPDFSIEVV
jgi:hypothetical protein